MRLVLALAVGLAWTGGAVAQPAPDRYGPPRPVATPATPAVLYEGPMLRWAAKRAPAPAAAVAAVEPARPEQMILARQYVRAPQPGLRPALGLPASLYDAPPVAPSATQAAPAAAAPRQVAAAAAPPPRTAGAPTRLYSLHREYGMAPDAIPENGAGSGYVLIGPSDPAPASAPRDRAAADESSDRPF